MAQGLTFVGVKFFNILIHNDEHFCKNLILIIYRVGIYYLYTW